MICPKCGHKQSGTRECAECGILFEKYQAVLKRRSERAAQKALEEPGKPAPDAEENLPSGIFSRFMKIYIWDTFKSPWKPVPKYGVIALTLFFTWLFYLLYFEEFYQLYPKTNIMDSRLLGMISRVNLVFHEGGHLIFGITGNRTLTILGGSFNQVLIPLIVTVAFWQRRDTSGTAFGLVWIFINLLEVGRYMADARHPVLPLIGGLDAFQSHDWINLFKIWDLWSYDTAIAKTTYYSGWTGMIATALWYLWTGLTTRPKDEDFEPPGNDQVRPPREKKIETKIKVRRPLEI